MNIPKTSDDFKNEFYFSIDLIDKIGDLRIRQFTEKLNNVPDEIIVTGIIKIFKNTDIIEFTYKPITHPGFNGIEKIISMLKENTNLTEKQIMNRLNVIFGN